METGESWLGMEGLINGHPYLIRIRETMQSFINAKRYNHRFDIVWKYTAVDETMMPQAAQMLQMEEAEQDLLGVLEKDEQAMLTMVYLGNNQKVLYWYSSNLEETAKRINAVLQSTPELPVEIFASEDAEWKQYKTVLPSSSR
ncbi:DUF695 domain-containing protein [Segetibacter sp. 3557_3]|uniref:DUF695 domain-containing protein n=1 Tax=Segetibacter sp. 3557_3 TaxID=2547429 RepID=UPI001058E3E2|nr:DUF695 domain-containing protein [Segetibacter sp. 3557_3]TDH26252.1 DUF695 domain-containing protein [Segetibacter sp. 3557_3]